MDARGALERGEGGAFLECATGADADVVSFLEADSGDRTSE